MYTPANWDRAWCVFVAPQPACKTRSRRVALSDICDEGLCMCMWVNVGVQRDTFNCTCPEVMYGQSGWACSCRLVDALEKAVGAAAAVGCEGALFVEVRLRAFTPH